jgi:hypothetical protein
MEILNGTQRAVQSAQMPNPSPIDPQRPHPQHLHGLPTPGRFLSPVSRYLIMDSCSPFSLLYRATCPGGSRICVADDAATTNTIVPDVRPTPPLPTGEITNI